MIGGVVTDKVLRVVHGFLLCFFLVFVHFIDTGLVFWVLLLDFLPGGFLTVAEQVGGEARVYVLGLVEKLGFNGIRLVAVGGHRTETHERHASHYLQFAFQFLKLFAECFVLSRQFGLNIDGILSIYFYVLHFFIFECNVIFIVQFVGLDNFGQH
jgi:hypothetical protein